MRKQMRLKNKLFFLSIALFLFYIPLFSTNLPSEITHDLSDDEKVLMHDWIKNRDPGLSPLAPVRPVAEFEPAQSVLIRYPLGIPVSFVKTLSQEINVITIVSNETVKNQAITAYTNAQVNLSKCQFMIAPTNSYWTRDYGPWFAFDANNHLSVIDFTYNRPRPYDDAIAPAYALFDTLNSYSMSIAQTGGNYMTDGIRIAASSHIAYTENSNNQTLVNQQMQNFLGITNYQVLQDPNNTYIDHIDCWAKFLAPDKILIRAVPASHSQYDELEAMADYFENLNSSYNRPFTVYRVNTPNNEPYTNSLILNDRVFVPIMNNSNDTQAIQAYQNAMPGYRIFGVLNNTSSPWVSTDALHCRTHEIPDKRMLTITHTPVSRLIDQNTSLNIQAEIKSMSQNNIIDDSCLVFYRLNQSDFTSSPLIEYNTHQYQASISSFAPGDTVFYYIQALDASGKKTFHPIMGKKDPHYFVISSDDPNPHVFPVQGTYHQAIQVSIQSLHPNTQIYYTIDGNEPTLQNGLLYQNPVLIDQSLTLKARLFSQGLPIGITITNTYTINLLDHYQPVWSGTPLVPHQFTINTVTINNTDLLPGDEIAVFDGQICVGALKITDNAGEVLHIIASKDDQNTETIDGFVNNHNVTFRIWDFDKQKEFKDNQISSDVISGSLLFNENTTTEINLSATSLRTQIIPLDQGWNLLSLNTSPDNLNVSEVFLDLINANTLTKIQSQNGASYEYISSLNQWINSIGEMSLLEGYRVKLNASDQLIISGVEADLPMNISLRNGWNIISYPYDEYFNAELLLNNLIDNNQLQKVIDESGNTIEYIQGIGWINNIDQFHPGEAYVVRVNENTLLNYPPKSILTQQGSYKSKMLKLYQQSPFNGTYFNKVWSGNGLKHCGFILELDPTLTNSIEIDDELAIFCDSFCVGSVKINKALDLPYIYIITSKNDSDFERNGYLNSYPYTLKLFKNKTQQEFTISDYSLISGQRLFQELETNHLKINSLPEASEVILPKLISSIYPNPFNEQLKIYCELNQSSTLKIEIYNLKGQKVRSLFNNNKSTGSHEILWDAKDVHNQSISSGIYFCVISNNSQKNIHKILYLK